MFKSRLRFCLILFLTVLSVVSFISGAAGADSSRIEILSVDGTIVPVIASYIDRGISRAESEGAVACIIELNTPGGLLNSTEDIVQRILNARVPVIVYVSPRGSWAASAGTFITLAGHPAGVGPRASTGAAPARAGRRGWWAGR